MINWPQSLVGELAERRCIVVLGAGASAGSIGQDGTTRPPDWEGFLREIAARIRDGADKEHALELIAAKQYLDAAQILMDNINSADFSDFVRLTLDRPRFRPSAIHNAVLSLDPKIVITLNYDQIYERLCQQDSHDGYNVCRYYEDHALNDVRSTTRVILKAHGCLTNPDRIVLTRAQYFHARNQYGAFYKLLDAFFLTNTLLFIGSSLSDPDIQLLLENANIAVPSSRPHYAVVDNGRHPAIKKAMRATYNLELLEYPVGQYDEIVSSLEELAGAVQSYRSTHS